MTTTIHPPSASRRASAKRRRTIDMHAAAIHAAIIADAGYADAVQIDHQLGMHRIEIDEDLRAAPAQVRRHVACLVGCLLGVDVTVRP